MTDITAARQRAETVLERMTQDKGPADCAWWAEAAWDLALAVIRLDDALHGVRDALEEIEHYSNTGDWHNKVARDALRQGAV